MTSVTDTGGYQQDLEDENESIASLVIQKDGSLKVQGTESLLLAAYRPFSSLLLTDLFLPYSLQTFFFLTPTFVLAPRTNRGMPAYVPQGQSSIKQTVVL